jgi:hypothetical protein
VQATKFVQYTGSNSAAVVALFTASNLVTTIVSEAAGVLTLRIVSDGGPFNGGADDTWVINQTDYVANVGGNSVQKITAAQLAAEWIVKA